VHTKIKTVRKMVNEQDLARIQEAAIEAFGPLAEEYNIQESLRKQRKKEIDAYMKFSGQTPYVPPKKIEEG